MIIESMVCYNLDLKEGIVGIGVVLSSWLIEWKLLFDCLLYCMHRIM